MFTIDVPPIRQFRIVPLAVIFMSLGFVACLDDDRFDDDDYHPEGWEAPNLHGTALKMQDDDCRTCHGQDLAGGMEQAEGVGCDDCHEAGWRTDCTFCHGGDEGASGAPPQGLASGATPTNLSFLAHTSHVTEQNHSPFGCEHCHVTPEDVLSLGHIFDDTDQGRVEIDFSGGLSPQAQWDREWGTCNNVYCHGSGRGADGYSEHTATELACGDCHAWSTSLPTAWAAQTANHIVHLVGGIVCADCHGNVVENGAIINPTLHVNGVPDVAIASTPLFQYNPTNGNCTGLCHTGFHLAETW